MNPTLTPTTQVPLLLARIHFGKLNLPGYQTEYIEKIQLREILHKTNTRALFCANPSTTELFKLFLLKFIFNRNIKISVFDLILRRPVGIKMQALALAKKLALKAVDLFLFIHRDTSGYEKFYSIERDKIRYIPFKANNLDLANQITSTDGDYIISCGASHRDFLTLFKAVEPLGYKTKIILSDLSCRLHNAYLGDGPLPENVERLRNVDDKRAFNELIAHARLVVIPILQNTIQPAGVSVYLEAMALEKPVIISRGSSTEGILNDSLAVTVPAGDATALGQAIKSLWEDAAHRAALGKAGRAYAHGLQGNIRMTVDIEQELVNLCCR